MTIYIVYIMAFYFSFMFLFGDRQDKVHAFIISLFALLNIFTSIEISTSTDQSYVSAFIEDTHISILWDGATALILTMFMVFDKTAWKQAILLAFAVLCHTMIIYNLTMQSFWLSLFFHSYYVELITLTGLLQIMVSYNGFIRAFNNLQELLLRTILYCNRGIKSLLTQTKRKSKT